MKKYGSALVVNNKSFSLSLEYILGVFEGDGSITIQLKPNASHKSGKQVILIFVIHQHVIDIDLLTAISVYLGCGKVEVGKKVGSPETWVYRLRISNQKDILNIILPLLQNQSMMLKKRNHDLNLFINSCLMVKDKQHLSEEGQEALKKMASQLSSKMTLEEKANLPETNTILNNDRVLGITDAEGHFSFIIVPSKSSSTNLSVNFNFLITQEKSEITFLTNLTKFFDCGNVFTNERGVGVFAVHNKKDLLNKIIPFFENNELQTIKKHSFNKFKKALKLCTSQNLLPSRLYEELNILLSDNIGKRPCPLAKIKI